MKMIDVTNLETDEVLSFTLTPHEAVRAAWAHEHGKIHDLNMDTLKTPCLIEGDRTISCGNWCAFN